MRAAAELLSEGFWTALAPRLSIRSGRLPASVPSEDAGAIEEAARGMGRDGYFTAREPALIPLAPGLAEAAGRLARLAIPVPFLFVYDETWECFQLLAPALRRILGMGYAAMPDFWAWHVGPGESGWGPHRDLGRKALAADGSPLVVTAWIPLSEATERNGCVRVVPAHMDPAYGTVAEEDLSASVRGRALPVSPGDWICWNDALLHWGGACFPGEPARVSLSMEFQRGDAAPFNRPLLWPLADLGLGRRIQLVAMQLLQYEHFCPLDPGWREFAEGQVSG